CRLAGRTLTIGQMCETFIVPFLEARARGSRLHRRVVKITGRSESQVEEIAHPIYADLGGTDVRVETTILATPGQIELHLASAGRNHEEIEAVLDADVSRL